MTCTFPPLAVDAGNTVVLTWELGGPSFSRPAMVPHSPDPAGGGSGSHQGLLMEKLALNGNETVAVVNSSMKSGERSRVWLMRGQLVK